MIGSLMMRVSVVVLVIGMLWGIEMGIRQDFALAPAHAHLNLVGGVLLFVFGLYYRLVPGAGASALAKVQGWLHIVGAIVFPLGVAIVIARESRWWQSRSSARSSCFWPLRCLPPLCSGRAEPRSPIGRQSHF